MACLNTLKLEIKTLEQIFTKNHERFQILNASVDEISCRFIGRNNKRYEIHANITVREQEKNTKLTDYNLILFFIIVYRYFFGLKTKGLPCFFAYFCKLGNLSNNAARVVCRK